MIAVELYDSYEAYIECSGTTLDIEDPDDVRRVVELAVKQGSLCVIYNTGILPDPEEMEEL